MKKHQDQQRAGHPLGDQAVDLESQQGPEKSSNSASPFYRSWAAKAQRGEGTGLKSHSAALGWD